MYSHLLVKKFPPLEHHIFVCTNEREEGHPRGSCARQGAAEVVQCFKQELLKKGFVGKVRAQKAGCLDTCENGVSVVVYPAGEWYGNVKVSDVSDIVDASLVQKKPLERCLMPGRNSKSNS